MRCFYDYCTGCVGFPYIDYAKTAIVKSDIGRLHLPSCTKQKNGDCESYRERKREIGFYKTEEATR